MRRIAAVAAIVMLAACSGGSEKNDSKMSQGEMVETLLRRMPSSSDLLYVAVNGVGVGKVTAGQTSLNWISDEAFESADLRGVYWAYVPTGTQVTLTVNTASGTVFAGWFGRSCQAMGTEPTCTVTLGGTVDVGVKFDFVTTAPRSAYTLSVHALSAYQNLDPIINATGATLTCSSARYAKECTASVPPNTQVTLSVPARADYVFKGWGGACSGTGDCTVTMNGDVSVTASFAIATPTYWVEGSVTGLVGTGLVLRNNGGDDLSVLASGPFTFVSKLATGTQYAVAVAQQPNGETCTVKNGSGAVGSSNVTNVAVTCTTATALAARSFDGVCGCGQVRDAAGGCADCSASLACPLGMTCGGGGTPGRCGGAAPITASFTSAPPDPRLWCVNTSAGASVQWANGRVALYVPRAVNAFADFYSVAAFPVGATMEAQANPARGQYADHKGIGFADSRVSSDASVGESFAAMWRGQDTDAYAEAKNSTGAYVPMIGRSYLTGSRLFSVARSSAQSVAIADGPTRVTISEPAAIPQGSLPVRFSAFTYTGGAPSTPITLDVTQVTVVMPTYAVGGSVSGLTGTGLVLRDNGGDDLPVTASGPFTFATTLASNTTYAVTVAQQPTNPPQVCVVTNGSGTIGSADLTNIAVSCAATGASMTVSRLTTDASRDVAPVWLPNGDIVFHSNRSSTRANGADIWQMKADGTAQHEIVHVTVSTPELWGDSGLAPGIAVLGNGDLIVKETQYYFEFMRVSTSTASAFPIVRTAWDGNEALFTRLLLITGGQDANDFAYGSKTGKVAWVHRASGVDRLRTAAYSSLSGQATDSYGTLLLSAQSIQGVSYSPDGTRVVTAVCSSSCGAGRAPDIFVLDATFGTVLQQLTTSGQVGTSNVYPRWSPDGNWIAFSATQNGSESIWVVAPATGESWRLELGMASSMPAWSPDSTSLAFVGKGSDGNQDIWIATNVIAPGSHQ